MSPPAGFIARDRGGGERPPARNPGPASPDNRGIRPAAERGVR